MSNAQDLAKLTILEERFRQEDGTLEADLRSFSEMQESNNRDHKLKLKDLAERVFEQYQSDPKVSALVRQSGTAMVLFDFCTEEGATCIYLTTQGRIEGKYVDSDSALCHERVETPRQAARLYANSLGPNRSILPLEQAELLLKRGIVQNIIKTIEGVSARFGDYLKNR